MAPEKNGGVRCPDNYASLIRVAALEDCTYFRTARLPPHIGFLKGIVDVDLAAGDTAETSEERGEREDCHEEVRSARL